MAYILNIETATKNCSVSLGKEGHQVDLIEYTGEGYSHAEKLHVFIQEILANNNISASDLDAIAVSKGPGSYTGLRIGVSAAKGMAYALKIPLLAISTLTSLAHQIQANNCYIIPMIDARRMEAYTAVYDEHYNQVRKVQADILEQNSYIEFLNDKKVFFIGDAVIKTKDIIVHKNAIFSSNKYPSALQMIKLSYKKYKANKFEDIAYFEPYYLKDFMATRKIKL